MQKLSLEGTQELVNSYVKSFGQSGAAKQLTEKGYRSPEGSSILQAHICRILNGSSTCLLAPETENRQQEPPIKERPIADAPPKRRREIEKILASEELLQKEIAKTAAEIEQDLIAEQAAIEELERSQPPMVPCTESRPYREARHLEHDIKISAVFNRRAPVELDEDRDFYGIPRMKHSKPAAIESRPYQPRQYGRNSLSTRDLSVRQK